MTILENLWYGNISPSERTVQKNSEYAKLSKESLACEDRFIQELSVEGRQAYDEHMRIQMALAGIDECDSFICGFRLGARMILEVLGTYDSQLPQIS